MYMLGQGVQQSAVNIAQAMDTFVQEMDAFVPYYALACHNAVAVGMIALHVSGATLCGTNG